MAIYNLDDCQDTSICVLNRQGQDIAHAASFHLLSFMCSPHNSRVEQFTSGLSRSEIGSSVGNGAMAEPSQQHVREARCPIKGKDFLVQF